MALAMRIGGIFGHRLEDPTGEHQQLVNALREFLRNISSADVAASVLTGGMCFKAVADT
jgi:hypothetical protein